MKHGDNHFMSLWNKRIKLQVHCCSHLWNKCEDHGRRSRKKKMCCVCLGHNQGSETLQNLHRKSRMWTRLSWDTGQGWVPFLLEKYVLDDSFFLFLNVIVPPMSITNYTAHNSRSNLISRESPLKKILF